MRQFFVILALITLLGEFPLDEWNKINEVKQKQMVAFIGSSWCKLIDCRTAVITVELNEEDDTVYINGECKERKL